MARVVHLSEEDYQRGLSLLRELEAIAVVRSMEAHRQGDKQNEAYFAKNLATLKDMVTAYELAEEDPV